MKNNSRKILCIFAAFALLMSMCSCTVNKTQKSKGSKDGQVVNYSALSTVDGTAAVTYTYTDVAGNKKTQKVDIDMETVDTVEMVESRDISSEKFLNGVAQNGYQMDEEKAKEVAANPGKYKEFQFVEYIQNNSEKTMAYRSVKIPDNGKNGIWIKTTLDAEFTMIPGGVSEIYVYGIADMEKYDGKSLKEAFKSMKVQLEYTLVDSALDDIDWDNADLKTIDIH